MLIASDIFERKTCIVSIRSGALVYLIGMSLISMCLGLLSPWLLLQLCICGGLHLYIFMKALRMKNDPTRFLYNPLVRGGPRNQPSVQGSNND